VIALLLAAFAAALAGAGFATVAWPVAAILGALGVSYAGFFVWQRRFSTRLTADGIEVQGYVRHFVPWSEVTDIVVGGSPAPAGRQTPITGKPWDSPVRQPRSPGVADFGGSRRKLATVRVARSHGRSVILHAPVVTSWQDDPDFTDKAKSHPPVVAGPSRRD
jgi:hypothetical protein